MKLGLGLVRRISFDLVLSGSFVGFAFEGRRRRRRDGGMGGRRDEGWCECLRACVVG